MWKLFLLAGLTCLPLFAQETFWRADVDRYGDSTLPYQGRHRLTIEAALSDLTSLVEKLDPGLPAFELGVALRQRIRLRGTERGLVRPMVSLMARLTQEGALDPVARLEPILARINPPLAQSLSSRLALGEAEEPGRPSPWRRNATRLGVAGCLNDVFYGFLDGAEKGLAVGAGGGAAIGSFVPAIGTTAGAATGSLGGIGVGGATGAVREYRKSEDCQPKEKPKEKTNQEKNDDDEKKKKRSQRKGRKGPSRFR